MIGSVALLVSAWIEIFSAYLSRDEWESHSS